MSLNIHSARHKRVDMFNSEEGTLIREALEKLEADSTYSTLEAYTSDLETYPKGKMPFVDAHLLYLNKNPHVNPAHYLSNLRLKIRIR